MTDISAPIQILNQPLAWAADIEDIYLLSYPQKTATEAKTLTRLLKSKAVYGAIACQGTQMMGFILLLTSGEVADILEICVAPSAREQGIGELLLAAGIAQSSSQAQRQIMLEVAEDNLVAQQLYRRAGFHQIGRRAGYYQRGTIKLDALILQKQL